MDLVIKQYIDRTETVSSSLIDVLYHLTKPDPSTGQPAANAVLVGRLEAQAAYEDAVNFLNTKFSSEQDNGSDFQVTVLNNNYYIRFADSAVESVLKTALGKTEGEGITTQEAADNSIGECLSNNSDITTFNEFKYFRKNNTNTTYKINNCPSLVSIDLSECTNYPGGTFQNLPNLEYFNGPNSESGVLAFPEGTTTIGYFMSFQNLPKLKHIIFPSTMRSFSANEFNGCPNIETITLNPGFETFGGNSFNQAGNGKLIISDLNAFFNITWAPNNGFVNFFRPCPYFYLKDSNGDLTEITTVTIPQTKLTIPGAIFKDCKSITEVVFHSGITSIGNRAFATCSNLVIPDLNLPNLASLGSEAFIGTKVQTISNLGSVTIIPDGCFWGCKTTSVTIPSSVTIIEKCAFAGCLLTSIDLGNVVTIKEGAFKDNQALTGTLIIPDSVVNIIKECFGGIRISNLEIGTGIENIGEIAFYNNPNLTTVTVKALTPPTLGSVNLPTFRNCNNLAHIYVPAQSVSAYQSASGWSTYAGIIQAIPTI